MCRPSMQALAHGAAPTRRGRGRELSKGDYRLSKVFCIVYGVLQGFVRFRWISKVLLNSFLYRVSIWVLLGLLLTMSVLSRILEAFL